MFQPRACWMNTAPENMSTSGRGGPQVRTGAQLRLAPAGPRRRASRAPSRSDGLALAGLAPVAGAPEARDSSPRREVPRRRGLQGLGPDRALGAAPPAWVRTEILVKMYRNSESTDR